MSLINYTVNINSKDRVNPKSPSNISTFIIRDVINLSSKRKIFLSVPYVNLPPTFYNVDNNNHFLTFIEDAVPTSTQFTLKITIPNGNYSVPEFITALTTAMTTISASSGYANTYDASYDPATGLLSVFITGSPTNRTFTYTFLGTNQDLKCFLGFNNQDYNNITVPFPAALTPAQPVYSYTGPNSVNFTDSLSAIYLRCNISRSSGSYSTDENNSSDIMKVVPIYSNGFSQVIYSNYQGLPDQRIELMNWINTRMTFFFTNQYNQQVTFQNYDWSMILLCQYDNNIR